MTRCWLTQTSGCILKLCSSSDSFRGAESLNQLANRLPTAQRIPFGSIPHPTRLPRRQISVECRGGEESEYLYLLCNPKAQAYIRATTINSRVGVK